MPLGLFDSQGFWLCGVEGIQRTSRFGAVCYQWWHPLGVRLHPRRDVHGAVVHEGAGGGAGGKVELAGLVHDPPVVDDKVVSHCQLVLRVTAVQAVHHLRLRAFKLFTNFPNRIVIDDCGIIRRVFWEQVTGQLLLKPLVFPGERQRGAVLSSARQTGAATATSSLLGLAKAKLRFT